MTNCEEKCSERYKNRDVSEHSSVQWQVHQVSFHLILVCVRERFETTPYQEVITLEIVTDFGIPESTTKPIRTIFTKRSAND